MGIVGQVHATQPGAGFGHIKGQGFSAGLTFCIELFDELVLFVGQVQIIVSVFELADSMVVCDVAGVYDVFGFFRDHFAL